MLIPRSPLVPDITNPPDLVLHKSREVHIAHNPPGFTLQLELSNPLAGIATNSEILIEIPGVLCVCCRPEADADRRSQNYAPADQAGSTVIEATLHLDCPHHPEWKRLTIGMLVGEPVGRALTVRVTAASFAMFADGSLKDEEFPFGEISFPQVSIWEVAPSVSEARFWQNAIPLIEGAPSAVRTDSCMQYWTPDGHNTWVGDVAAIAYNGRIHLFYLFDRRHHGSRFGCGAHYFEHISSSDLIHWTEHTPAVPIEHPAEAVGTGSPFVFGGKLYLAYGLHTTRMVPLANTTLPEQRKVLEQSGQTRRFGPADAEGLYPAGSTYSVMEELGGSFQFEKSGVSFHPCENPSVYIDNHGALRMFANYGARGTWQSNSVDEGWNCLDPDFPPGGDCTFWFQFGAFEYTVGGFIGFWRRPVGSEQPWEDLTAAGRDVYDGICVPAPISIPDSYPDANLAGRCLFAGWAAIRGWGGVLLLRELVVRPDGYPGLRWLPEVMPATGTDIFASTLSSEQAEVTIPAPGLLTVVAELPLATGGLLMVHIISGDGTVTFLRIDVGARRAEFGGTGSEALAQPIRNGGRPHQEAADLEHAHNYSVDQLPLFSDTLSLLVALRWDTKLGGTIIDCEINALRTMLTFRPDFVPVGCRLTVDGCSLETIAFAPFIVA